jgi:hypothetical protein
MAAVAAGGLLGKGRDISLAALQRHDPYITCIVDVASQVALYTFGHRANEWVRADAAGRADPGWAGTGGARLRAEEPVREEPPKVPGIRVGRPTREPTGLGKRLQCLGCPRPKTDGRTPERKAQFGAALVPWGRRTGTTGPVPECQS